jgi:hypothetical protein
MALGGVAAALGSLGLWLRSSGDGSVATLVAVAVGAAAAVYAVVAVAVRPRATPEGTAYRVLTPSGSLSRYGLRVTNPDATVPGRLVVSGSEVTWSVRGVRLRFPRDLVERAEVRRAPSLRALGYLTLHLKGSGTVVGRIFQPGPIERELRAAGYPVDG